MEAGAAHVGVLYRAPFPGAVQMPVPNRPRKYYINTTEPVCVLTDSGHGQLTLLASTPSLPPIRQ